MQHSPQFLTKLGVHEVIGQKYGAQQLTQRVPASRTKFLGAAAR